MDINSKTIIILPRHRSVKDLLFLLFCIATVLTMYLFELLVFYKQRYFFLSINIFAALILSISFFFYLYQKISKKPAIIVTDRGLTEQSTPLSIGFIGWEQVLGAEIKKRNLLIFLKDPSADDGFYRRYYWFGVCF